MPLIVMTGYPSSGKTTWALKLADYFKKEKDLGEVVIVKEEEYLKEHKNSVLDDSRKEKDLRAKVKSEAQRLLTKDNVVIIDALNYIKGYRYEIYCISKAIPTRQVTVQTDVSEGQAWEWNLSRPDQDRFVKDVFDHLVQRYEAPDPQNRWDAPFFSVLAGEELDMNGIYESLFLKKPPKQNMSTQSKPVSGSNFLHSLEKVTSEIIQDIVHQQNKLKLDPSLGEDEEEQEEIEISVPHTDNKVKVRLQNALTLTQLTKLKRQFVTMTKNPNSGMKGEVGDLFVQYLNSQLSCR